MKENQSSPNDRLRFFNTQPTPVNLLLILCGFYIIFPTLIRFFSFSNPVSKFPFYIKFPRCEVKDFGSGLNAHRESQVKEYNNTTSFFVEKINKARSQKIKSKWNK